MLARPSLWDAQRRTNLAVYQAAAVVADYAARRDLPCNEGAALLRHHHAFAGRDVLDIGVGAGRTTRFLAPLARRYEAIDYSHGMVDHMRRTMPEISTTLCDACELSPFADASFDFVCASNCVIDALSPPDRVKALREASRVLRPGGLYVFSSHNLRYRHALDEPRLVFEGTAMQKLRALRRWWRQRRNHERVGPMRRIERDYALLDDTGHDYALLHYYIDAEGQRLQLARAGLTLVDVIDSNGHVLQAGESAADDLILLYVARRDA